MDQVIELSLERAHDMFEMPQADLFSEYRSFLTGVDFSLSVLRSRRDRSPVQLEISLPPSEIDEATAGMIGDTLERYCRHRIEYNQRELKAVRYAGLGSLKIGLPITILGFVLVYLAAEIGGQNTSSNIVLDTGGWVLAWVGLWYPLDTLLFTPLPYSRENQALRLLQVATINLRPRPG